MRRSIRAASARTILEIYRKLRACRSAADLQGVREQEKTLARFHLVIIPPGFLEIFASDLLKSNVLFQFADVLLSLDKLKIFRAVLYLPTPPSCLAK